MSQYYVVLRDAPGRLLCVVSNFVAMASPFLRVCSPHWLVVGHFAINRWFVSTFTSVYPGMRVPSTPRHWPMWRCFLWPMSWLLFFCVGTLVSDSQIHCSHKNSMAAPHKKPWQSVLLCSSWTGYAFSVLQSQSVRHSKIYIDKLSATVLPMCSWCLQILTWHLVVLVLKFPVGSLRFWIFAPPCPTLPLWPLTTHLFYDGIPLAPCHLQYCTHSLVVYRFYIHPAPGTVNLNHSYVGLL